jgi:ribosomal protein S18 acetylase RimI-like enzyme
LLHAAEREVQNRGGNSIGLNVFSANVVALRLYESCGYEITSLNMRKLLGPGDYG